MIELLKNRRSCRKYQKKRVDEEQIALLAQSALLAPSSRGLRPWQFVFVDQSELILSLSKAKVHGSAFARLAPLILVIAADPEISDVWIEDCSIAAILVQLQAEKMGLASCWVQLRNRYTSSGEASSIFVKELLKIPSELEVPFFLTIGYRADERIPYHLDELPDSKIHRNSFGEFIRFNGL
ncbi:MAG: nitroreductase family protein [Spirochaetales bacterium]|nr:nitroreductase family protein [Spirochaetales bacterium]